MSVEELQGVVGAIAGVAASQVERGAADEPVVRVWLDGTRDPDLVASDVDRTLRDAGFVPRRSPIEPGPADVATASEPAPQFRPSRPNGERSARRTGLGRGLDALIQPAEDLPRIAGPIGVTSIAVLQTAAGTSVRVTDSEGRSAEAPVDSGLGEFLAAATGAVAALLGIEAVPMLTASDERGFGGARVVSVVVDAGGDSFAGSAVVESGELLAYAQAMWAALRPLS